MKKLAIIITHPIQYNSPWFKFLNARGEIKIKVFYTWSQAKEKVYDEGFGKEIKWDIPLLKGYDYLFVDNNSRKPGLGRFAGIVSPLLNSEVEEWNPDAVLIFGWNYYSHFKAMKYFKGKIPVLFRGDSTLIDETISIKTLVRRVLLKIVYRFVDTAFYVGKNNRKYFLKHGLKENQLIFAPHAIDNERFIDNSERNYELKAENWREELGYKEDDIVILFAGKFETKKNPEMLVKVFNKLLTNHQPPTNNLKLLLVGNGVLEEEIKNMSKVNPNIQFIPFQNQKQMPVLYRVADLYCLPSNGPGETWGLAVNEAMACGRPAAVSDRAGCAIDLVRHGYNGWIFDHTSIDDLVNIIKVAVSSKENLKTMGENANRFIQDWSFEKICSVIENTI